MSVLSSIIAWILIGLAAGYVAGILPGHRGPRGFAINVAAGIAGAVLSGLLGYGLGLYRPLANPFGFFLAMLGAVIVLGVYHALLIRHHARVRAH